MTSDERQALLELWRDVPETAPRLLHYDCTAFCIDGGCDMLPDDCASALARDAIVEWLLCKGFESFEWGMGTPECDDDHVLTLSLRSFSGQSRLLALITAARSALAPGSGGEKPTPTPPDRAE